MRVPGAGTRPTRVSGLRTRMVTVLATWGGVAALQVIAAVVNMVEPASTDVTESPLTTSENVTVALATWVDPKPRVLTSGIFKFRSTPSGSLPTDADILRTITNGLHTTFMPRWAPTTPIERRDLVQYVKALSPRFKEEEQGTPIVVPPVPPMTPQLATQGKQVWDKMQCAACHGDTGQGNGASASTLRDDWGFAAPPHDFTRGPLKVGDAPEDLYRAFMTGLNGSPMPSFADSISPEDAWALVAYVRSLRKD